MKAVARKCFTMVSPEGKRSSGARTPNNGPCGSAPRKRPWLVQAGLPERSLPGSFPAGRPDGLGWSPMCRPKASDPVSRANAPVRATRRQQAAPAASRPNPQGPAAARRRQPARRSARGDARQATQRGPLGGHWSLRVSAIWRIVFRFEDGAVLDVDFVDQHWRRKRR